MEQVGSASTSTPSGYTRSRRNALLGLAMFPSNSHNLRFESRAALETQPALSIAT
jgi:hypothetical protein